MSDLIVSARRAHRVAIALARHGFGELVTRLGWKIAPASLSPESSRARLGQRLACVLADLGPTYVKLGQLLATREDVHHLRATLTSGAGSKPQVREVGPKELAKPQVYVDFDAVAAGKASLKVEAFDKADKAIGKGENGTAVVGGKVNTVHVDVKLDAGAATAQDAASGGPRPLHGIRVLVVDDRDDQVELTALMLRGEGAEVKTASAAPRAYQIAEVWRPDVLVCDLAMPNEDGFTLLHGLRRSLAAHGASLSAVALSAHATAEYQLRATEAGFDVYLSKPVDPQKFAEVVADCARRAR